MGVGLVFSFLQKYEPALNIHVFTQDARIYDQAVNKFLKIIECWVSFDRGFSSDF